MPCTRKPHSSCRADACTECLCYGIRASRAARMTAVACLPVAETPFLPPDVLVLASGGTLGEAWMSGVLAGIEDATGHDFRTTESLVGTSAGSLVAAAPAAGARRAARPAPR